MVPSRSTAAATVSRAKLASARPRWWTPSAPATPLPASSSPDICWAGLWRAAWSAPPHFPQRSAPCRAPCRPTSIFMRPGAINGRSGTAERPPSASSEHLCAGAADFNDRRRQLCLRLFSAAQQIRALLLVTGNRRRLHRPVSADLQRECGQFAGELIAILAQISAEANDHRLVLRHQAALGAPLLAVAKHIERRTTQTPEACQDAEHWQYPRPELAFFWPPGGRVDAREQGRRKPQGERFGRFELRGQRGLEFGTAVQARHLVLVLVGHQAIGAVRHCPAELFFTHVQRAFRSGCPRHQIAVALRVRFILIARQFRSVGVHQLCQRAPYWRRRRAAGQALQRLRLA